MPGYERAAFTVELTVTPSESEKKPPKESLEAAKEMAGASGLAHEAGPDSILLAGERREVLEAAMKTIEAALDAGAREVTLKVEAEGDALRFGDGDER
ncbi:MAG: hypothetical protein H0W54_03610 [Rubrobacter sp.]|nr:hypothetical protein [Rubrobacter sp.]